MISEFDPSICCDHVQHGGDGWLECPRCGAKCTRDHDGKIEIYSRGTKDVPKYEAFIKREMS